MVAAWDFVLHKRQGQLAILGASDVAVASGLGSLSYETTSKAGPSCALAVFDFSFLLRA